MLNRTTITGRMTHDPELRTTPSSVSVTSFSIACQRDFKNAAGERETDFIDIVAWRATAEFVCKYFSKGSMVSVDGRLASRKYTDKNGNNRTVIEIVADNVYFGDSKSDGGQTGGQNQDAGGDDFVPDFSSGNRGFEDIVDDGGFPPFPG